MGKQQNQPCNSDLETIPSVEAHHAEDSFRFGVAKQLGLGFAVVLLLTVILAGVALRGQLSAEDVIDDVVEGYGSSSLLALQAKNELLLARNAEKDYILSYRDDINMGGVNDAVVVRQHLSSMQQVLDNAEKLLGNAASVPESRRLLAMIRQDSLAYEVAFFEMVRLFAQRGNHNYGLESQFHQSMQEMEALLVPTHTSRMGQHAHLIVDVLSIKKHEQTYLLHQNADALRRLQEELDHFILYVSNDPADALYVQLKKLLIDYQRSFQAWVEVNQQAEQSMGKFSTSAAQLDQSLADWYTLLSKHVFEVEHALEDGMERDRTILLGVAVLAILLGLMVAMVLSRRIGGAVRHISKAATLLAKGDLTSRVELPAGDEFAELAAVFNTMSEGLVSKRYTQNIFASLSDSLLVIDDHKMILEVNRATLDLLGYQKGELCGQPIDMILHGDKGGGGLQQTYTDAELKHIECFYVTKSGRKLPVLFSASALRNEQQRRIGTVCVAQDLSEQKIMEAALQEKQSQLIHAGRLTALGEMSAGIAHEINQPLNAISLASQWLLGEMEKRRSNQEELESMREILTQIERVNTIICNVRSFSRRRQQQDKTLFPIALEKSVKVAFSFFEQQFRVEGIQLTFDADKEIPKVTMDPQKFEQVMINFCSNARYAVEEQAQYKGKDYQPYVRVSLRYKRKKGLVVLQVKDNGCGMLDEQRRRCLEPFYTTKPVGQGTGLGLSIVHAIVKEFRMGFEIISEVGTGTTVRISMEINDD